MHLKYRQRLSVTKVSYRVEGNDSKGVVVGQDGDGGGVGGPNCHPIGGTLKGQYE